MAMQPILLLHGAIGAKDQLQPLAAALEVQYKVHAIDFSGHGKEAFPDAQLSMQLFAEDVLKYMDTNGLDKVSIFGYSMGGYVALYLAKHHPERIDKVITLATKFHWDDATAQKETGMLDPEKIEAKLPAFAATLAQRHAGKDWKEVLHRTADMLRALGEDNTLKPGDYADIQSPSLILLGDRDKMVGLEETLAVYKELPNAQMGLLPGTAHPIEQVDVEMLGFFVRRALK
jgi:pimeloyl-ACP methyl ester carboxylesterase